MGIIELLLMFKCDHGVMIVVFHVIIHDLHSSSLFNDHTSQILAGHTVT